jgi:Predicted membrane protein
LVIIRKHILWFTRRTQDNRLDSTSAHGAYFIIISFLPFAVFLLTLFQQINISDASLLDSLLQIFPEDVASYVEGLLAESTPLSSILSVSVITFLWSASSGMVAIIKGFNIIYGIEEKRGYLRLRLASMVYLLVFATALVMTAVTQVFGSNLYALILLHSPKPVADLLRFFRSSAGLVMLIFFFCLIFHVLPRRRLQSKVKFRNNLMGAIFSAVGWVVFSLFFSIFVKNFSNFSVVYGSLATLIVLMFWLYSCMYIMFVGAEIAVWLEHSGVVQDVSELFEKFKQRNANDGGTE